MRNTIFVIFRVPNCLIGGIHCGINFMPYSALQTASYSEYTICHILRFKQLDPRNALLAIFRVPNSLICRMHYLPYSAFQTAWYVECTICHIPRSKQLDTWNALLAIFCVPNSLIRGMHYLPYSAFQTAWYVECTICHILCSKQLGMQNILQIFNQVYVYIDNPHLTRSQKDGGGTGTGSCVGLWHCNCRWIAVDTRMLEEMDIAGPVMVQWLFPLVEVERD